ncbi:TIGR02206 family membrane protein [Mesobacillus subterraneus]|uniref:YwaF family protein n=1 Tax=Mesobacillus subterraneus TaxID=285983 RepID=UPI00204179C5|nr:TIGR02206 family membrane protein [Mesobacillus subterraneus]MCM3665402.1 TIGR02206 family membrane protein [Mesobacillus subterraneus]MCM3684590.1 TIGR02206 family membrane protein [Mesobacillus subterraneus]
MEWFGPSNTTFDFDIFSQSHLVILAIFVTVSVVIFLCRHQLKNDKWRKAEIGVSFSLILIEIANHVWMYVHGIWKLGRSMPLELCNIGLLLSIVLLLTRKKVFFELLFFIALLGATQAIITPALTYDFPHFRFFHFFYAHMMVVWVTLYFTWAKGYFPTFSSVVKVIVFINLLLPVILFVNKKADGNYWFLRHKPESPSFLDLLGPYPWYIFSLESLLFFLSFTAWLLLRNREKTGRGDSYPSVDKI